jgi:UTP-glucose-1-phosphate uridylyltransferase
VNDGTRGNDARLGALRDLALALDASQPRGERAPWPPVLVVAGDTLFRPDFHLAAFVASGRRAVASGRADLVLTYYGLASAAEVSKRGVLELGGDEADEDGLRPVLRFMEKPQPSETPSRMACPPLYIYSPRAVDLLAEYLAEHSHQLSFCDAPGSWIPWLLRRGRVLAYGPLSGRFDIGSLNDYRMADAFFLAHEDR